MNDRELLEMAAKAAGRDITWKEPSCGGGELAYTGAGSYMPIAWNPLADDGDALRLAMKLNISLHYMNGRVVAYHKNIECIESSREDGEVNTRRAIVRAASEIGKAIP